jgi:hypothetical protein
MPITSFTGFMFSILAAQDPADSGRYDFRGGASSGAASGFGDDPSASSHAVAAAHPGLFQLPDHWPGQLDLVQWCSQMGPGLAAILVIAGVIYLLFGYQIFKTLMVVNAAVVGAFIGAMLGDRVGAMIPLGIIGAVLMAALVWPTMKHAVAVMGAVFGALVGATVWHSVGLDPRFAWSGACIGLVAGGLLCFILFRGCIVMYTSLHGAVILIFPALALILKYQHLSPHGGHYLTLKPFLLPMCIFIPAVAGMMYQQHVPSAAKPPPAPPKKSEKMWEK